MKNDSTIRSRRRPDGTWEQVLADGTTRPMSPGKTDWARLDAMGDAEIEAAAKADPDNPPLTPEQLARMKPVSEVKRLRWKLGLSQEAFAKRYRIPLSAVRDWERHIAEPDQAVKAYLKVIAADPEGVAVVLEEAS